LPQAFLDAVHAERSAEVRPASEGRRGRSGTPAAIAERVLASNELFDHVNAICTPAATRPMTGQSRGAKSTT
jgi:hypothetical protein